MNKKNNLLKSKIMTRYIIVSLLFFSFVILFITTFLLPKGKEYKNAKVAYNKVYYKYKALKEEELSRIKKLDILKEKNDFILSAFKNKFDEKNFQSKSSKFFNSIKISKIVEKKEHYNTKIYEAKVSYIAGFPKKFYKFLEDLNKGKNVISVLFPIKFEKEGDKVYSSFILKIFNLGHNVFDDMNSTD